MGGVGSGNWFRLFRKTTGDSDSSLVPSVNSGPGGGTAKFRLHQLELQIP